MNGDRPCTVAPVVLAVALALALALAPGQAVAAGPASRSHHALAHKKRPPRLPPPLRMTHLSTHETLVLRPDPAGRLGTRQLRAARHFLRCHHTGREHAMAPRLLQLLYQAAHHFHDAPMEIIAGYRAPRVAREKGNPRSHHKEGRACDFRLVGVANTALRDWLRTTFHNVGVGYYPNAGFIHLDVRERKSGYWVDYSSPGQAARYTEEEPTEAEPDAAEEPDVPPAPVDPAPPAAAPEPAPPTAPADGNGAAPPMVKPTGE